MRWRLSVESQAESLTAVHAAALNFRLAADHRNISRNFSMPLSDPKQMPVNYEGTQVREVSVGMSSRRDARLDHTSVEHMRIFDDELQRLIAKKQSIEAELQKYSRFAFSVAQQEIIGKFRTPDRSRAEWFKKREEMMRAKDLLLSELKPLDLQIIKFRKKRNDMNDQRPDMPGLLVQILRELRGLRQEIKTWMERSKPG
jgi:hypothetical protein